MSGVSRDAVTEAFENVEREVWWYRASTAGPDQFPTLKEQRTELCELKARAEGLGEALGCLSGRSQRAIAMERAAPDHTTLLSQVNALVRGTAVTLDHLPIDRGGRKRGDAILHLAVRIGVFWKLHGGRGFGVTKSGDRYDGPLARLVKAIFALEGVRAPQTLARQLYMKRSEIQHAAAQERQEREQARDYERMNPAPSLQEILAGR